MPGTEPAGQDAGAQVVGYSIVQLLCGKIKKTIMKTKIKYVKLNLSDCYWKLTNTGTGKIKVEGQFKNMPIETEIEDMRIWDDADDLSAKYRLSFVIRNIYDEMIEHLLDCTVFYLKKYQTNGLYPIYEVKRGVMCGYPIYLVNPGKFDKNGNPNGFRDDMDIRYSKSQMRYNIYDNYYIFSEKEMSNINNFNLE